jgi:glycosyltransferase involved in cell wall biosynthesis
MTKRKILIFIVSYNAEPYILEVLNRIPENVLFNDLYDTEILVLDDESKDQTFDTAFDYAALQEKKKITVLTNPVNQGYGGNQKLGYFYAVQNHFDVVILLHGDGQYPPEFMDEMIQPIINDEADFVLASRMIDRAGALKGNMPVYKWVGNQILTFIQNKILHSRLSEFHTGYRAYRVSSLKQIPFSKNSDYFDFDTDILIQLMDTKNRCKEISIPTFYGTEVSHVDGIRYGMQIIITSLISRIMRAGIYYDPRFDYTKENEHYQSKLGFESSQRFALGKVSPGSLVLDLGCGPGLVTQAIANKGAKVISVDRFITKEVEENSYKVFDKDLNDFDYSQIQDPINLVLALDLIEHLHSPEAFLNSLRDRFCWSNTDIILTTGNVAFLPVRLSLLLGQFNYSNRGILDLDHSRLFTFTSFRRLLKRSGYLISEEVGIPAPFPLAIGDNKSARFLLIINRLLIFLSKGIFSYQMAFVVRPKPNLKCLLDNAYQASNLIDLNH